jgi:hypothetical protein
MVGHLEFLRLKRVVAAEVIGIGAILCYADKPASGLGDLVALLV